MELKLRDNSCLFVTLSKDGLWFVWLKALEASKWTLSYDYIVWNSISVVDKYISVAESRAERKCEGFGDTNGGANNQSGFLKMTVHSRCDF